MSNITTADLEDEMTLLKVAEISVRNDLIKKK